MTDVRRTGPPHRLEDRTRIGVPIAGEVDGIWQRAMQAEIIAAIHEQPDLPGSDFFGRSLSISPDQVKFFFDGSADLLPRYLDMIEAAIPRANQVAQAQRDRLLAADAEVEHQLHDRDAAMEQEMSAWTARQPAAHIAGAETVRVPS